MSAKPHSSGIRFFYQTTSFSLQNRTELKQFIEKLFAQYKKPLGSLNYIFTTDKALLKINRDFLKHDYYTDIITFDLGNPDAVEAEIYISIDRVKENAITHLASFKEELHRVIFHGVLHLCGHSDKDQPAAQKMRKAENSALASYFNL